MKAILLAAALSVAVPAAAQPAPPAARPAAAAQLSALLQRNVAAGAPGYTVAIADGRGIVWTGAVGAADIAARRAMRPDAPLGIGSITKVFVAVVALQLVEEGRLKLTDTPASVLPPALVRGIANAGTATVADLLAHRAGVPSWEDDPRWIRAARGAGLDPRRIWNRTETLDYIRGTPATGPAGGAFAYSNSHYTLLGLMIGQVTGHHADAEVRRRILTPLGLRDTFFEGLEPGPRSRVPHRYHYATAAFEKTAGIAPTFTRLRPDLVDVGETNLSDEWTAGGLISSARDLVTFARALRDGRLLKPASLAFMQQWTPAEPGVEEGHGLFRYDRPDGRLIGHSGGVLGFTALLWWAEDADVVVAVLCNGSPMHAGKAPPDAGIALSRDFVALARQIAAQRAAPAPKR